MHNVDRPKDTELPSSKQLIKSTALALVTALILLVTVILPAEYGVDPTGIGQTLGLKKMGEIKRQLASEAEQNRPQAANEKNQPVAKEVALPKVLEVEAVIKMEPAKTIPSETRSVELQPGEAAEIKLAMSKGAIVTYQWSVDSGHVNYDTHGDSANTNYFGYNKGKSSTEDSGELQAEFDGKHGWFWRNRSDHTVVVTLVVSGNYSDIQKVL
ncbi:MAG: hypothetical protein ACI82A_002382 [Candidatus Azotimanducaceae bacterium]|jgi:hypothetical protein